MLPTFYQTHLQKQLTHAQFILLKILLDLIQSEKQVRLEQLLQGYFPIQLWSKVLPSKLQRFLDLPHLTLTLIWFPLITYWLTTYCSAGQTISIAIDRSQWGCINLFTLALIWHKRAIPLYWCLLPKLGNSNLQEQTFALQKLLLLKEYKIIVLGNREFCSADLASWLKTMGVSFCLRLKKNHCLATENLIWQRLARLGIVPGTSLYFQGVRVRKTRPVVGFDIACKWKRNYQGLKGKEAWFILTDLGSLAVAIAA